MSHTANKYRGALPQPMVVVALLFLAGLVVGWRFDFELSALLLLMALSVAISLFRGGRMLLCTLALFCGVISMTYHRAESLEEGARYEVWRCDKLHDWAGERVNRLGLSAESESLLLSMVLGDRGDMSDDMRQSYNRSGAAHLLAISGLHLAIVYSVIYFLSQLCHLFSYGHLIRNLVILISLWGYVAMVGTNVTVVRAAVMISSLLISRTMHRRYSSYNALSLAVVVIALANPSAILQPSFWLSVLAVVSIFCWAIPLISRAERWSSQRGWGIVPTMLFRYLSSSFIIGLCCTIALMPILSHLFGYISLWGLVVNSLIIMTTLLIISLCVVWILFGIALLAPLFRLLIESFAALQNSLVEAASNGWREPLAFHLEMWEVMTIYMLYVAISLFATHRSESKRTT